MKTPRAILHQMALDAWSAGVSLLVLFLALEAVSPGFVSRFFNLLWLLLFIMASSIAVMATQGHLQSDDAHHSRKGVHALLFAATVALSAAAWFLLPESLHVFWRSAAAGGILLAALLAWPVFSKH